MTLCRRGLGSTCRWIWNIPYVRTLCLFATLAICCVLYLASQTPMSKIYIKYHTQPQLLERAKNLNRVRFQKAQTYFDNMRKSRSLNALNTNPVTYRNRIGLPSIPEHPSLVVGIISAKRSSSDTAKSGYLVQTAAVMDQIIKHDTAFNNTVFLICNVDRQPEEHVFAKELRPFIHFVNKHGKNSVNRTYDKYNFVSKNEKFARGRETEDYIYCLNVSHSFGAPHVLMLEDDVLPYKNVFSVLDYTLKSRDLNSRGRTFSFIKLHYPDRWLGFAFEFDRLVELLSISAVGGAIFYLTVAMFSRHNIQNSVKLFYYIFGTSLTLICASIIGRQYLMDLRRFHPQLFKFEPTAQCCTPAMWYNKDVIPSLIKYLINHSAKNKDLAIYDFTEEYSVPGYQLQPNLFRHIGLYTSLGDGHKPPEEFLFDLDV